MTTKNLFQVGRHMLSVFGSDGTWVVAVDGILLRPRHRSRDDAWAAGLAEVERLDAELEISEGMTARRGG